jgi:hypothetical protein
VFAKAVQTPGLVEDGCNGRGQFAYIIVFGAFLSIGEGFIGSADFLEFFGETVRLVFADQAKVCPFYFLITCGFLYSQGLVIAFFHFIKKKQKNLRK